MRGIFPEYELTVVDEAEGARPGLDAPLAQHFVRAVGAEARPKYGWTDVARFSALGIPAVNFGPGDPLKAHADDERVATDQIVCRASVRCARGSPAQPEGDTMTSAPVERERDAVPRDALLAARPLAPAALVGEGRRSSTPPRAR